MGPSPVRWTPQDWGKRSAVSLVLASLCCFAVVALYLLEPRTHFDLLSTIKLGLTEPAWSGHGVEAYLFAALVYFAFCFSFSRYSRRFEQPGRITTLTPN